MGVLLFICCPLVFGQVNQEIYSDQDLLAIDSEIQPQVVVLPPSGGFGLDIDNAVAGSTEVQQSQIFNPSDGSHSFSYVLPDGTKHSQSGYFSPMGYVLTGSWEWISPDGQLHKTEFVADHEGYKPRILEPVGRKRTGRKLLKSKKNRNGKKRPIKRKKKLTLKQRRKAKLV